MLSLQTFQVFNVAGPPSPPSLHNSAMPILDRSRSASPPSSPPRMSEDAKTLKMKNPEELMANPMDILKSNPFLLPAQLLALNPQLYAAQFAQLQAAQMLLAKQTLDSSEENGDAVSSRKRGGEALETEQKQKQSRSSSPKPGDFLPRPLDLSGSRSPEMKTQENFPAMMNPMMQAGLLNFFTQLRPPLSSPGAGSPPSPPGRAHSSPWQAQWASRNCDGGTGPEDVFKCVWCKESYHSLEQLTKHMREAKHHHMPQYGLPGLRADPRPPVSSPVRPSIPLSAPSVPSPPRPERDVLRDQMPIPRKLVRGQDVWIGRADQQTKDILKCMSCGESFRSLEMLTKHMQETQHYKKVISHDQISAWKYPETQQQSSKNHVNSVLTCKVCDKGFSSLKELSDHMVRANHYTVEANKMARAPPVPPPAAAKDRKKALPVKKLLELERARHEILGGAGAGGAGKSVNTARDIMETGKLVCERCEDKIPLDFYIAHIQQCVGRPRFINPTVKVETEPGEEKPNEQEQKAESSGGSSHSSILGSLEQLVKGNFHGSPNKRQTVSSSPPMRGNNSIGKFSIQNMFGKDCPDSPGSSVVSPNSSRPGSVGPGAASDKMIDSPPVELQTNGNSNNHSASPTLERNNRAGDKVEDKAEDNDPSRAQENFEENNEKEVELGSPPPLQSKSPAGTEKEKKSDNPLAALQMLCDTQKKTPKTPKITENNLSDPGSMMAFSWACNQAMSSDSVIKCPFCDTPFISKGAYRHHLSKMHFTKENLGNISSPNIPQIGERAVNKSGPGGPPGASHRTPSPEAKDAEESLQSKYQKYSQLAKQLSCYDGTN